MQDMFKVTQDWEQGKTLIFGQLELKLRYWECLPWIFAALVHNDDGVARAIARIAKLWDALDPSEKVPGQQHQITIMIPTAELRHYLYKAKQTHDNTISQ